MPCPCEYRGNGSAVSLQAGYGRDTAVPFPYKFYLRMMYNRRQIQFFKGMCGVGNRLDYNSINYHDK